MGKKIREHTWWAEEKIKKNRRVSNVAFVHKHTGKILLHKRKKEKYLWVDYWAFFWGRIEKKLNSTETAIKEIQEELWIILNSNSLIHVVQTKVEKEKELIVRDVFLVFTDTAENEFITQEKDGEDGMYFEFEDAVKLAFRNDISLEILLVQKKVEEIICNFIHQSPQFSIWFFKKLYTYITFWG